MRERNIFIGLGGSGVNTVASLKYKIYSNTPGEHPLETMEENYRFLFCDTDQADILRKNEYYKSKFEGGRKLFIDPKNDLINLGTVNPYAVYEEAKEYISTLKVGTDLGILPELTDLKVQKMNLYSKPARRCLCPRIFDDPMMMPISDFGGAIIFSSAPAVSPPFT